MRKSFLLSLILVSFAARGQDSTSYWKAKYDSAATRYIQAKIALFNIQDCLNKIQGRPKNAVYTLSWLSRIQDDLNHFYTVNKVNRPVLVHKKKTVPKKSH